jgi:hypothetical protein
MTQKPTARDWPIIATTALVLIINAALYGVGILVSRGMLVAAGGVSLVVLGCYLAWTPVAYELADGQLTVHFRIGRVRYGPVVDCGRVERSLLGSIGLVRNGGVFAVSGIFWNSGMGTFRAYATACKPARLLLVQTQRHKVIITPENPEAFLAAATDGK